MAQQPPVDEKTALLASLQSQRRHILGILEGLSQEDLGQSVLPSGWTCLSLVHHLALDVERFWFRAVVVGDQSVIASLDDEEDAWQVGPDMTGEQVFALYRGEIE